MAPEIAFDHDKKLSRGGSLVLFGRRLAGPVFYFYDVMHAFFSAGTSSRSNDLPAMPACRRLAGLGRIEEVYGFGGSTAPA